jgi:cobalamin synthase
VGWRRASYAGIITRDIERVIAQEAKKANNSSSDNEASARNSSPQQDKSAIPVLSMKDLATAFALMMIGYALSIVWLAAEIVARWLNNTFWGRNGHRKKMKLLLD